jgi:site-specific DNA recombinase
MSHDPYAQRAGVERQLADCTTIANMKGWGGNVVVYEDNDRSALTGRRPEFERMIADLPRLSGVIAWDMDRLVRQPRDLERFLDACDAAKVSRVVTAQGDMDLTKEDSRLHARILGAVAKKESMDKSRRVSRAAQDRAERGLWNGGPVPYGYRRGETPGVLDIDPEAAAVVREVALAVVEGMSLAAVAKLYGRTKMGWRALLLSPTIVGRTSAGPAQWPGIIDSTLAADVRSVLTDPKRLSQHTTERQRWLSGILRCGSCDGWMRWHGAEGGRQPRYRCIGCRRVTVTAATVEAFVKGALLESAPRLAPSKDEPPRSDHTVGQEQNEARLVEIGLDYARGFISRSEWIAMRAVLTEITTASAPTPIAPTSAITAEAWDDWTPTERYRAALWVFEHISVLPSREAGRSLDDRVQFTWRR